MWEKKKNRVKCSEKRTLKCGRLLYYYMYLYVNGLYDTGKEEEEDSLDT